MVYNFNNLGRYSRKDIESAASHHQQKVKIWKLKYEPPLRTVPKDSIAGKSTNQERIPTAKSQFQVPGKKGWALG
ncbi:hypothetical protein NPIL_32771 [Nephila pilipes]|uniref:Uncharacterized protein n=1 Tax=Nephila pilipes TaxID=299642 RepID=A0A8X6TCL6_NEPPI|nr:hypothetical protein NPIL_32771 [Nephila pilipes]